MLPLLALLAAPQTAPPPPPPGADAGFFGQAVVRLHDVNGDGVRDLAVGAPRYRFAYPVPTGCVFVLSGADATELAAWSPSPADLAEGLGNGFGGDLRAAGDLDGDGVDDLLIRASPPAATFAWSAARGQELFRLGDSFPDVWPLGDLDGDGRADLLATRGDDGWCVLSGRDAGLLTEVVETPDAKVLMLDDGNGDGLADGVSADGRWLFETERVEGGLRFHRAAAGLAEGRRRPYRVEVIPGADGGRELLSVDARGPRIRVHRMGPGRLELLAEVSLDGEDLKQDIAPLRVLALPREGGHDLIVAAKRESGPFHFTVRRLRPGQREPLWTERVFYPITARFTLAHGGRGSTSSRILLGTSATGFSGGFHAHGSVRALSAETGRESAVLEEKETLLARRFERETRWRKRLLIFEGDPEACRAQVAALRASDPAGFTERKLVVIELHGLLTIEHIGDAGLQLPTGFLRRLARLDRAPFHAALIGLDGGVKHRAAEPLSPVELFGLIDRMPMRREELERR